VSDTLTAKQEQFVQNILSGMTQRDAYRGAFNSSKMKDKSVDEVACRLLKEIKITSRLKELQDEIKERNIVTVEYVLQSLINVAERCQQAEPVMIRVDGEMVPSGEYRFDSSGANKSLELLGKTLKMFTDKTELTGKDGTELVIKVTYV